MQILNGLCTSQSASVSHAVMMTAVREVGIYFCQYHVASLISLKSTLCGRKSHSAGIIRSMALLWDGTFEIQGMKDVQ
jgi:hypothetical protein